jgi:AcrR family transcriptional regulator
MADRRAAPRRAGLSQERSRLTRQQLVRAALAIWTERGFERGVEETTVEEIVSAAGVTKGTFYFHFARKEVILLEMGWETAAVVNAEAERCLDAERDLDDSVNRVIRALARHVEAAPPAAVARAVTEFRRLADTELVGRGRADFGTGIEALMARGRATGRLPETTDTAELAQVLRALWMDSILDWAAGHSALTPALRRRTAVVLAGVVGVSPTEPGEPAGGSPNGPGTPPLRVAGARPA